MGPAKEDLPVPLPSCDDSADSYIRGGLLGLMLNRDIRWPDEKGFACVSDDR